MLIVGGALLVGLALAWFAVRNLEAIHALVAMDTVLGWITHGAALLILAGGVALLAGGVFGSAPQDAPE
ncbi:hypothetical protein GCM10009651_17770 [Microbacterium natoriense]|nr:hypothetical protein CQ047_16670 [Microbacterium sp. MYb72]